MNKTLSPDELRQLTVSDRLRLIEDLWASLEEREDAVPIPDWHRRVLDERLADMERDPGGDLSWDEVKAEILAKLRK